MYGKRVIVHARDFPFLREMDHQRTDNFSGIGYRAIKRTVQHIRSVIGIHISIFRRFGFLFGFLCLSGIGRSILTAAAG